MPYDPFDPLDPETGNVVPDSEPEPWTSPFEQLVGSSTFQGAAQATSAISRPDPMIGTPRQDVACFPGQQSYSDTCAIRCQEFILEQFTGAPWDEGALVNEAMQHGWYTPGEGTPMNVIGNQLELHGIPVHRYTEANVFHLANELAQGHKVIVGIDSGEIWGQDPVRESMDDALGINGADHAVVVSGIDTSDPANVRVIVSDPGTGEAAASYPMNEFLDAWQDSGFYMVATSVPAPAWLPEMANFDYELGHLPSVSGMPYEEFLALEHQPDRWSELGETQTTLEEAELVPDLVESGIAPAWEPEIDGLGGWDGEDDLDSLPFDDADDDIDDGTDDDEAFFA